MEIFVILMVGLIVWSIVSSILKAQKQDRRLRALQLSDIDNMSGVQFENYVAKLLHHQGFQTQMTKVSGDLGVDIIAKKANLNYSIQVKRQAKNVSRRAVSDAVAGKIHYGCTTAMVVTNIYFTDGAKQLAQSTGCKLIDRMELTSWIIDFQNSETSNQVTL